LEAITQKLQEVGFKASFISGLMMPVLNAISDLTYLIVAILGGLQVISGQLTIGNMQAFVQYVWQVSQPIQNLTQLAGQLQSAKSSLDRGFHGRPVKSCSSLSDTSLTSSASSRTWKTRSKEDLALCN